MRPSSSFKNDEHNDEDDDDGDNDTADEEEEELEDGFCSGDKWDLAFDDIFYELE